MKLAMSSGLLRGSMGLALVGIVALGVGAASSNDPRIAAPLVLIVVTAGWYSVRGQDAWWDLLIFVLGGLYLLDYGFANIGLAGSVPIPLVDLIAVVLLARAMTRPAFRFPASLPFTLATAFIALTFVRLAVDVPRFGLVAIRDATMAIELSFLFVGYWVIKEYGLPRLVRVLSVVFVVGLVYVSLYPFRDTLVTASPMVGLQRPVPLVGAFTASAIVLAGALFFFAIVRPFGARSYVLAAAALPLLALLQGRGLYIVLPATLLFIVVLGRTVKTVEVRRGLVTTLVIGAVGLAVVFSIAPEGRLGKVTPGFVVDQILTIEGREGPGSGSLDDRREWFESVMRQLGEKPTAWVVGLGLGPDLAQGFASEKDVLVRKPHNDYLETLARLGLPGLALLVGLLVTALARVIRAARYEDGVAGRFLWFATAQSVFIALLAATQPLLAFPYGTVPLFLILGAALAVAERGSAAGPHAVR